jgi:hypothetical protein
VAHAYYPSYSGGRDQEDNGSKPVWASSSMGPYLEKPFTKVGLVEWLKVKALSSSPSTSTTHTHTYTQKQDCPVGMASYFSHSLAGSPQRKDCAILKVQGMDSQGLLTSGELMLILLECHRSQYKRVCGPCTLFQL